MTSLADQFEALAKKAQIYNPDTLNYACAATVDLANWIMRNRTAISSALTSAPPVQEGWRGIETAPRDGTYFDAWMRNPEFPNGYRLPSCSFSTDKGEFVDAHGMFLHVAGDPRTGKWRICPTHWRPLPAAPEPSAVEDDHA